MIRQKLLWCAALSLIGSILLSPSAHADCLDPVAEAGALIYNADENVPQVCADTDWVALGVLNATAGSGGCSNPNGDEGAIIYNADIKKPQYCDGENWIEINAKITEAPSCFLPVGECPAASGSHVGCISSGTLSWGAVSCSTSGDKFKITFSAPKVDVGDGAYPPGGGDSSGVRTSAQYWCEDLGLGSEDLSYNTSGSYNYWAPQNHDTNWFYRPTTGDYYTTSVDCFVNVNAR